MGEDPKKPEEILRSGIKSFVEATNGALSKIQQAVEPVSTALETAKAHSHIAMDHAKETYNRRHEYPVEIIGASSLVGGGTLLLRRGRIAGLIGAAACGGAAYAVVYDEIKLDEIDLKEMYGSFFDKKD